MSIISDMIREAREAAGLTRRQAAKQFGCTQPEWSRWESGVRQPRPERLEAIMKFLRRKAMK